MTHTQPPEAPPSLETSPSAGPPPGRRLGLRDAVIAAVVLINIALPLSYYVGRSDSPLARYDERFAWRMFSPVRIAKCQVELFDARETPAKKLRLDRELHVVWVNLLKRARPAVVERVLDRFCADGGPDADIRISMICTPPDASSKTICDGPDDRDGDGIPDAYAKSHYCGDLSPGDCFRDECGERTPAACYRDTCRATMLDRETNRCADRGAI